MCYTANVYFFFIVVSHSNSESEPKPREYLSHCRYLNSLDDSVVAKTQEMFMQVGGRWCPHKSIIIFTSRYVCPLCFLYLRCGSMHVHAGGWALVSPYVHHHLEIYTQHELCTEEHMMCMRVE